MGHSSKLLLICLLALLLRLALLPLIQHPGIADPNHYYNLGLRLLHGHGFTIDYIWQYYNPPESIVHPEDFWMPLAGVLAALSMAVFGESVQAAVLPFVLIGSLLPLIGYFAARQMQCSETSSLFAAAALAVLPELVLNSLRTDTTIPNTLFMGVAILLLTVGLQRGSTRALLGSGAAMGLAYLTRGDNLLLLPMFIVTVLAYALLVRGQMRARVWQLALVPLIALLVVSPWLLRNLQVSGSVLTPNLNRLFFLVDFRDHYAYERDFTLETLLASQTPAQIVGKRLFEMAASVKTLYTTLDLFLPVLLAVGLIGVWINRERARLLALAPVLILLGGTYVFYTLLAPIANQGGSFKKAYLSMIPLLVPLAAYGVDWALAQRPRALVMVIALGLMTANAVELVRAEVRAVGTYLNYMETVADAARELGDTNGDGEIILMAQDPFMLRFFGISSVAIPMEDRETILEVARRYHVDYLMMPPARPALDPLFDGEDTDPRFVPLRDLPAIHVQLYGFRFEDD
jgi:hypothetical protein